MLFIYIALYIIVAAITIFHIPIMPNLDDPWLPLQPLYICQWWIFGNFSLVGCVMYFLATSDDKESSYKLRTDITTAAPVKISFKIVLAFFLASLTVILLSGLIGTSTSFLSLTEGAKAAIFFFYHFSMGCLQLAVLGFVPYVIIRWLLNRQKATGEETCRN